MKTLILVMVVLIAAYSLYSSAKTGKELNAQEKAEINWITDFEQAKKLSAVQNKPIFADFAGSDWCHWCVKLDKEVLSTKIFAEFAKENLILFLADFPSQKNTQSPELAAQNQKLASRFGVRGFPTVLLIDSEGKVLHRTGYRSGGAEAYVSHVKELLGSNN